MSFFLYSAVHILICAYSTALVRRRNSNKQQCEGNMATAKVSWQLPREAPLQALDIDIVNS